MLAPMHNLRLWPKVGALGALFPLAIAAACGGGAFQGNEDEDAGGAGPTSSTGGEENAGSSGATMGAGATAGSDLAQGGEPASIACTRDDDCDASDACVSVACLDGACVSTPELPGTPCAGGICDQTGACSSSTCDSDSKDGDETGVDCGGSCGPCPDGEPCGANTDCLSGVCENEECRSSDCTDKTKNGDESDVDCGGSCALKCELGQGCGTVADCVVGAGAPPESVRCLGAVCTSTAPPASAGPHHYWQDFAAQSVRVADSCGAADGVCLVTKTGGYAMHGVNASGAGQAITAARLLTTDGVVGGAGQFDGRVCLTRTNSNLSLADQAAFTAMAWVKSTKTQAPWESVIIGAPQRYAIAVDANPSSQRFLAGLLTTQSASFDYYSAAEVGPLAAGQWHHVAQVHSSQGSRMRQYVDGKEVHSTTLAGAVASGVVSVYLGCRRDAGWDQFFVGSLDEVVLYTRALSAEELADYVRRTAP